MSYCVHCGVELDATASFCPLCHTRVLDPGQPVDTVSPKPFPTRRGEVARRPNRRWRCSLPPCSPRWRCAAAYSICFCGRTGPGRCTSSARRPCCGCGWCRRCWPGDAPAAAAVAGHRGGGPVRLSDLGGSQWGDWYLGLAAPIILWGGAILLLLGLVLRVYRRSALTTLTILIGSIGVFVFGMEFFVDRWLHQLWSPSWSLVVLTICIGMVIPLIIIRRVPALREEARRRFHL